MKRPGIIVYTLPLFMLSCISCKDNNKENITRLVTEWQGKEVLLPENSIFTIQGKDTVPFPATADHKILVYVDSVGCTSCRLQLHRWKEFIAEVDSISGGAVQFLFYLSPKNVKEARYITRRDDFIHPMCIDLDNEINRINQFPEEDMFHTFLLDSANNVKVIGNPIHNRAVHELYMKTLTGRDTEKTTNTIVEISELKKDLGTLSVGEEKTVSFTLRNKGEHPLVIFDVTTACDCTNVKYPKKAIKPGECAEITVNYRADQKGIFNKSITVYSNAGDEPVRLHIRGKVK